MEERRVNIMTHDQKIKNAICPTCVTSKPMTKITGETHGGFYCFECGVQYRPPVCESQDMSGQRWFRTDIVGGPRWVKKQNIEITTLQLQMKVALAAYMDLKYGK
jgi:hypothetical protein